MKKFEIDNDDENNNYDIVFGRNKNNEDELGIDIDAVKFTRSQDSSNGGKNSKKKSKRSSAAKKLKAQRIVAGILVFCVTLGIIGTASVWAFAKEAWKKNPDMYAQDFYSMSTTKFVDTNNEVFYVTGLKTADAITYEELPQVLVDAFIATEDSRFFEHGGVDVPRFTKAMMINVKDSISRMRLSFSQGGSTITMQLIKNTYFVNEDVEGGDSHLAASSGIEGVQRKFQELYLATKLEKDKIISKKEQIAFYLNNIYFGAGNNTMGIQSSSKQYFNKDVSQLNLVESAFLAGVINAPNAYSPYQSIQKAKERTQTILNLMKLHGYITEEEHKVASAVPIENLFVDRNSGGSDDLEFQAYVDIVLDEVKELTGHNATSTAMTVYTHMNRSVQESIDKVQRREVVNLNPTDSFMQMGSAIVENGTGAIVGVFGGYDYNTQMAFNRARDTKAQPGSVIKAVLSYPLAFEHLGISTEHILTDAPYVYAGMSADKGQVTNYDNVYRGDVTLDFSFADSRNTTAITLLEESAAKIGNDGVVKYLNQIGLVDVKGFNISYAIGGGEMTASPLQLAEALSTVMNYGEHIKPTSISRIEYVSEGVEDYIHEPKKEQVLDPASAYLTASLMNYSVNGPYPGYMAVTRKSYPVFGKTGTNGWSLEGTKRLGIPMGSAKNRNMFTATDRFSISTWIGFDNEAKETKPWINDRLAAMNIQGNFNSYILNVLAQEFGPGKALTKPDNVVDITHIKGPFPYQRPIEGMRDDMIVTGQINKKYLTLVDPNPQPLDGLKEAVVESSQMGNQVSANVALTPYPDESKLTVAPNTKEMPLRGTDKVYTGTRLYDDSWLYGAVEYVVDVLIDGQLKDTVRSSNATVGIKVNVPKGSKLELCAYYGYTNSSTEISNKICTEVELKNVQDDEMTTLPVASTHINDFRPAANKGGITINLRPASSTDPNQFGKIKSVTLGNGESFLDVAGKTLSNEEIKKQTLVIEVYDYNYNIANHPDMTIGKFYDTYKNTINIKEPKAEDMGKPITAFNGNETSISLLTFYSKQLVIK